MSNDEGMTRLDCQMKAVRISSFGFCRLPVLPPLTGITHGRQAFAELRLLPFSFPLLARLTRLLLGARTRPGTAQHREKKRRNQKHGRREPFHRKLKNTTIVGGINPASSPAAKADYSTLVTSYSPTVRSLYLCSSAL